jgi:hypothetical protein
VSAHLKAQLLRFARATGYAFIAALLATGGNLSWWDLLTLLAGATEAGLRQVFQVQEVASVTSVPAPPGGDAP